VRVILLLALCVAIDAQADPQVWINPGIYSLHFDRDKDLRDDNIGLGVELVLAPEHAVSAGTFINSNRERSRYVAYAWRPLRWELRGVDVALGVVAGAFHGYPNYRDGGWFLAPLPLLAVEGRRLGLNLSVIPTIRNRLDGAIAIQLKLRVW
jgi:hypothetical protein